MPYSNTQNCRFFPSFVLSKIYILISEGVTSSVNKLLTKSISVNLDISGYLEPTCNLM